MPEHEEDAGGVPRAGGAAQGSFVLLKLDVTNRSNIKATIEGTAASVDEAVKLAMGQTSVAGARFAVAKLEKVFQLKPTYSVEDLNKLVEGAEK